MLRTFRLGPIVALGAALVAALPGSALAQGCASRPFANAGNDVSDCTPAVGSTDFSLTGNLSLSSPINGPINQYCWLTEHGTFLESGTNTHCAPTAGVTLRSPNARGRSMFNVQLTVTDVAGCSDTDSIAFDLSTRPVITRAEMSRPVICLGDALDMLASAVNTFDVNGLVEYHWDLDTSLDSDRNGFPDDDDDAVITGVSGNLTVATLTPTRTGSYEARLRVIIAGNPCIESRTVPYRVDVGPTVRLLVGPVTACPGDVTTFQAELAFGDPTAEISWDFDTATDADGDGIPWNDIQAAGARVPWQWTTAGTFTVRARALASSGCRGFAERDVTVFPAPAAAFTTAGPGCGPLAVTFTDRSTGVGTLAVSWDFGDGSPLESGATRTHLYSQPGVYSVRHYVTSEEGCLTTETRLISVARSAAAIEGITLLDGQPGTGSSGNANGFADPGERVRFVVDVRNEGSGEVTGLVAGVTTTDLASLFLVTDAQADFGPIAPGGRGSTLAPHLEATISSVTPCGATIPADISVALPGAGACSTGRSLPLRIGVPGLSRPGAEVPITATPGRADQPDVVAGAGAHLIALNDASSGLGRIRVSRVDRAGTRLAEDALVDEGRGAARAPQAAWSPALAQFAVAWIATENTGQQGPGNVVARWRTLDAGARPLGVPRRLDISGHAESVDIAWAGQHWLAAWIERTGTGAPAQLFVQAISADGLFLGLPVALGGAVTDPGVVRIAGGASRVLVAHRTGSDLRLFTVEGLRPPVATSQQTLSGAGGVPAVIAFGAGFLLGIEDGAGGVDLAWMSAAGQLTRTRAGAGSQPSLAHDLEMTLIAWRSGADVIARVVGATGVAAGSDFIVTPGTDAASQPTASALSGLVLVAFASTGGSGNVNVRAAVLAPSLPEGCPRGVLGDVAPTPGGNGFVDIGDVVLVLRVAVGLEALTADILERGDVAPGVRVGSEHRVTGDGRVDIGDAVVLMQATTSLIVLTR